MTDKELKYYKNLYRDIVGHSGITVGQTVVCINNGTSTRLRKNKKSDNLIIGEKYLIIGIDPSNKFFKIILNDSDDDNYPNYNDFTWDKFVSIDTYRDMVINDLLNEDE